LPLDGSGSRGRERGQIIGLHPAIDPARRFFYKRNLRPTASLGHRLYLAPLGQNANFLPGQRPGGSNIYSRAARAGYNQRSRGYGRDGGIEANFCHKSTPILCRAVQDGLVQRGLVGHLPAVRVIRVVVGRITQTHDPMPKRAPRLVIALGHRQRGIIHEGDVRIWRV